MRTSVSLAPPLSASNVSRRPFTICSTVVRYAAHPQTRVGLHQFTPSPSSQHHCPPFGRRCSSSAEAGGDLKSAASMGKAINAVLLPTADPTGGLPEVLQCSWPEKSGVLAALMRNRERCRGAPARR